MNTREKELPLVSVAIALYNMEQYVSETLDSVLQSDYPNLEVIVMNDGSTDGSLQIVEQYQKQWPNLHCYSQTNQGAVTARNEAIRRASGKYILPVDADNRIAPDFISAAVEVLESNPEVKVVAPSAEFIGDRSGEWKLPPFSRELLASRNMMDTCAMYAKTEWERVGGYNKEIIAREDWVFWIAVLKDGGKVVKLPKVGLYYRIRSGSKRITDRKLKKHVVATVNKLHPDFFQRELGGPLHTCRSWSRLINRVKGWFSGYRMKVNPDYLELTSFIYNLPEKFATEGEYIYQGRNELKKFNCCGHELIVKSYRYPIFINRIVYGLLRASKAERSYDYAHKFLNAGIGSPSPIGFITERSKGLLGKSYFVSLKSACDKQYTDFKKQEFKNHTEILEAIGRTTAIMHENGFLHKDYSAGNILFRDEVPVPIEIIDLNRMRFQPIDLKTGCKNFERLPGTPEMFEVMGRAYARQRKMDEKECISLINKFHEK